MRSFDAFEELEDGLLASCEPAEYDPSEVEAVLARYGVQYTMEDVAKVNWNEEWEKNYDPVIVRDECVVRATFHDPRPDFPYEIIITPKMSFGTGHHATTYQVLDYQLSLDHTGKRVLDVGCGTGALAIMASKRGASEVSAVDIDEWCIENSQENFSLNSCEHIGIQLGGIEVIAEDRKFELILANINKNVLMDQMEAYVSHLAPQGGLVLSGFYQEDIDDLQALATSLGLSRSHHTVKDRWAMMAFVYR